MVEASKPQGPPNDDRPTEAAPFPLISPVNLSQVWILRHVATNTTQNRNVLTEWHVIRLCMTDYNNSNLFTKSTVKLQLNKFIFSSPTGNNRDKVPTGHGSLVYKYNNRQGADRSHTHYKYVESWTVTTPFNWTAISFLSSEIFHSRTKFQYFGNIKFPQLLDTSLWYQLRLIAALRNSKQILNEFPSDKDYRTISVPVPWLVRMTKQMFYYYCQVVRRVGRSCLLLTS